MSRMAALIVLAMSMVGCDSVLPPRQAVGSLQATVGQGAARRTFFSEPRAFEIPRGDSFEVSISGCPFALSVREEDSTGALYDLRLTQVCEARMRAGLAAEGGRQPGFVDFMDAQRAAQAGDSDRLATEFPPRTVRLEGITGDFFVLESMLQMDARGPCVDESVCFDASEMRLDIQGSVE